MWKYILMGVLAIGILSAGVRVATLALFTDTVAVTSNTFSTGTVDLTTGTATALITLTTAAPGDMVVAPLTVTNNGTLAIRYAMERLAVDGTPSGLAAALKVRIAKQVGGTCDAVSTYFNADGTAGALGGGDTELTPAILFTGFPVTTTATIGDKTAGDDIGDRSLLTGTNETLCFAVVFPSGETGPQGSTGTDATFTFYAEQTANNP